MMLKKADEDYIADTQRQVTKLDEDLDAMQHASRKVQNLEEDLGRNLRQRSSYLDSTKEFWAGPEATRYRQQSIETLQAAQRDIRASIQNLQTEIKGEVRRLDQRKETLIEDIEHMKRIQQTESESALDGQ
ncbi:MAG: hypothetical protein FWD65_00810 [Coriobacteriia bacterium]|nr:hypothetical protein [Coriobacteriia bacterium]